MQIIDNKIIFTYFENDAIVTESTLLYNNYFVIIISVQMNGIGVSLINT